MLNVFAALERLVLTSERGLEKGYEIEDAMLERFDGMAALVRAGLDHVGEHLEHARPLDLDVAQDVELQLNAAEAEARGAWLAQLEDASGRTKARLWAVELAAAYESVGNQIYRLVATLEDDELL